MIYRAKKVKEEEAIWKDMWDEVKECERKEKEKADKEKAEKESNGEAEVKKTSFYQDDMQAFLFNARFDNENLN